MKENRWLKRVLQFLCLFALVSVLTVPAVCAFGTKEVQAKTTVSTGTFGDDISWKLTSDWKFTISGTGDMPEDASISSAIGGDCLNVTDVVIKSGITSLDTGLFIYMDALETISIPDTVTSISTLEEEDFYCCNSLKEISVSEDNTKYCSVDGVLYNKKQTTLLRYPNAKNAGGSFTIPSTVTKIGPYGFDCNFLSKITVPASVTKVSSRGFGIHLTAYGGGQTLVFRGSAPTFADDWSCPYDGTGDYTVKYPASEASSWKEIECVSMKSYKLSVKSVGEISLSSTSLAYAGKKRTPSVTVKVNEDTLKKGTDYTLSWSSSKRTSIGKYTVTITGKGNYTGTVKKTFKIVPKKVTLSSSTKSSSSKKLTVKWSKVSGSVTKYQIRYRVKGTSIWKTKTVSSSKSSYTLSGLKSGKTYQVQVRAYKTVSGTKYYGSWSSTKKVKVK